MAQVLTAIEQGTECFEASHDVLRGLCSVRSDHGRSGCLSEEPVAPRPYGLRVRQLLQGGCVDRDGIRTNPRRCPCVLDAAAFSVDAEADLLAAIDERVDP